MQFLFIHDKNIEPEWRARQLITHLSGSAFIQLLRDMSTIYLRDAEHNGRSEQDTNAPALDDMLKCNLGADFEERHGNCAEGCLNLAASASNPCANLEPEEMPLSPIGTLQEQWSQSETSWRTP